MSAHDSTLCLDHAQPYGGIDFVQQPAKHKLYVLTVIAARCTGCCCCVLLRRRWSREGGSAFFSWSRSLSLSACTLANRRSNFCVSAFARAAALISAC